MSDQSVVEAIHDLARILVAFNPEITSKSDAIRRLHMASVKPSRIASLLSMPAKDVTSLVSKINKSKGGNGKSPNRGRKEKRRG